MRTQYVLLSSQSLWVGCLHLPSRIPILPTLFNHTLQVSFQFMAYQHLYEATSASHAPRRPTSLVFTFRFFQFPPFRSEPMQLRRDPADTTNDPITDGETRLLTNGDATSGFVVSYNTATMLEDGSASSSEFVRYLNSRTLQVEIWDAQSGMLLGTCELDMRQMLRAGTAAVQCVLQPPVFRPHAAQETKNPDIGNVAGLGPSHPASRIGSLFIRVANIGQVCVPPSKEDSWAPSTTALVIRPEVHENQHDPNRSQATSLVEQVKPAVTECVLFWLRTSTTNVYLSHICVHSTCFAAHAHLTADGRLILRHWPTFTGICGARGAHTSFPSCVDDWILSLVWLWPGARTCRHTSRNQRHDP